MRVGVKKALLDLGNKSLLWLKIAVLVAAGIMPALTFDTADAAQLTSRKLTISTSEADTPATHTYNFTLSSAIDVEGIIFEYCTTPLGTCTKPAGLDVDKDVAQVNATQTFTVATAFAEVGTSTGDCNIAGTNADTKYCVNRTAAGNEADSVQKQIAIDTVTNPNLVGNSTTFYVRVSLYDNSTFTSGGGAGSQIVHNGVVAAAIVRQLTVTGRVAERLEFCVAAFTDNDGAPANCAAFPSTTSIAIGTIDAADVYVTPVEPTATNLADDRFGAAMVNTNASGGVVIQYFPEPATSVTASDADQTRAFRVIPTDCSNLATSLTDQCFQSAGATAVDFNALIGGANQERFGMQVPCVVANDTPRSTTANITIPGDYDNADNTITTSANCENPTTGDTGEEFAFVDTGAATTFASSATVVDDEMVKIRFGATASPTTPEGSYLVVMTYIATPTF